MRKILILFLLMLTASMAMAQMPSEDHYRDMITEFVRALNSEDTALRKDVLHTYYINADSASAIERWQGHFGRYHFQFGDLEVISVDIDAPQTVSALCHSSGKRNLNEWLNVVLNISPHNPAMFWSMSVETARDPDTELPDRPLTTDEIADLMDRYIENLVARDVFSGSVILAKDGEQFYSGAWGLANMRWQAPNNLETKFNIGSMNKMFTGVAICQLAEKGKLGFDDLVGKHLPEYPNADVREKVTIHHLLTHTSGMGSYWEAMATRDWTVLRSVEDFAALSYDDSLSFEPGDHFQYSNSGPLVLGLIIEKLSGLDYHEYIRRSVTGPAGMVGTDCYHNDHPVPNLASGYFWAAPDDTIRTSNIFEHSARGSAAGGGYSTAPDLQKFANALYDGTFLSAAMVETMTTGKVEMGPGDQYAYLFGVSDWNGHLAIGHGGGAPGINADLKIFKDLGVTIIAMSNYDMAASAVSQYAVDLITHKR